MSDTQDKKQIKKQIKNWGLEMDVAATAAHA